MKYRKWLSKAAAVFLWCILLLMPLQAYADEGDIEESGGLAEGEDIRSFELEHYELGEVPVLYANGRLENIHNIVVFVRFSDSEEYINNTKIGYADLTYNSDAQSLNQYVKRLTYGAVNVSTSFFPNSGGNYYSVQLSQPADFYKKQYTKSDGTLSAGYTTYEERIERERSMVNEALAAVKNQVESSGLLLDDNGDAIVDGIAFVVPTRGSYVENNIGYSDLLWPHKISGMNTSVTLCGSRVSTFNLLGIGTETNGIAGSVKRESRTLIHEFMHTLGMPDLYRYNDQSAYPLGPWDIMDGGSTNPVNMNAYYQREYLGFGASLPVVTDAGEGKSITLTKASYEDPNEQYAVILKPDAASGEFFVVEYRGQEDRAQMNTGLIVYRINTAVSAENGNKNADGNQIKDFIFAFRPDETAYNKGGGYIWYAALSPDNQKGFTSLGKPSGEENEGYDNGIIYYSDGTNSGIVIDHIVINGTSATFNVTFSEPEEIKGTEENPYEIYTVEDLQSIGGSRSGVYYKLMNNIDCSGKTVKSIEAFAGILDGGNYTISNLTITSNQTAEFIQSVKAGSVIKNLNFKNPVLTAGKDSGNAAVIGHNAGEIENVHIIGGTITAPNGYAGALAFSSEGKISRVTSSASVSGKRAGGLMYQMSGGSMDTVYVCGSVKSTGSAGNNGSIGEAGGICTDWLDHLTMDCKDVFWDIRGTGQNVFGYTFSGAETIRGVSGLEVQLASGCIVDDTMTAKIAVTGSGTVPKGQWQSDNTQVLTVDASSGVCKAKKAGTANVKYTFSVAGKSFALQQQVKVTEKQYTPVEKFVIRLYENVLNRQADPKGFKEWTQKLVSKENTGAQAAEGFVYSDELKKRNLSDSAYIDMLYATFLDRGADPSGKASWIHLLENGVSRAFIFKGFVESPEFSDICSRFGIERGSVVLTEPRDQNSGVTMFVFRCYDKVLGRKPDQDGLNAWANQLLLKAETPEEVAYGFVFSNEFKAKNLSDEEYVKVLYKTFLDRSYDEAGLKAWVARLQEGDSRYEVFRGFAYSDEFKKIAASFGL